MAKVTSGTWLDAPELLGTQGRHPCMVEVPLGSPRTTGAFITAALSGYSCFGLEKTLATLLG